MNKVVLDSVGFDLQAGEKAAIVGANGSGKTTLFKIILGLERPDYGHVSLSSGLDVGYLPQEARLDEDLTVWEHLHIEVEHIKRMQEKLQELRERIETADEAEQRKLMKSYDNLEKKFESAGGYDYERRIKTSLLSLGVDQELWGSRPGELSGGQRCRVSLAKVLVQPCDLLLLDEPTNHLDLSAVEWLERFLISYKGAMMLISHDRYLLDRVAGTVLELRIGRCRGYTGNYSQFVKQRAVERVTEERELAKRKEMVAETKDFVARNKDQEGMRGTARGRKKRLEKLLKDNPDYLESERRERKIEFKFSEDTAESEMVLQVTNLQKSFGDLSLFDKLSFEVTRGDRLAITGPNGTGKSTLLKIIYGMVEPTEGKVKVGQKLAIGYLDQHGRELECGKTVADVATDARQGKDVQYVRDLLAAFEFRGQDVHKKVSQLSGGQRNRLALCRQVLLEPDLLLLDEPTNHLDIDSTESLENALIEYKGTIVFISHDRYFIDRVGRRLMTVGMDRKGRKAMGNVHLYESGSKVYSAMLERAAEALEDSNKNKTKKKIKEKNNKTEYKTPVELRKYNKFKIEEIEEMILEAEIKIEKMHEDFGKAEIYQDPQRYEELTLEFEKAKRTRSELYRAYELRKNR
jgi:ATP-binding cassette subfamily F protein 3